MNDSNLYFIIFIVVSFMLSAMRNGQIKENFYYRPWRYNRFNNRYLHYPYLHSYYYQPTFTKRNCRRHFPCPPCQKGYKRRKNN